MDKVSFGTLLTDDPGGGNLNAGLWWTDIDYAMRVLPRPRLWRLKIIKSRRHADASLDLFVRKSPLSLRDLAEKRALSARRLFLWMVGV